MDKTQLIILLFSVAVAILAAGIIMVSIAYYRLKKAQREKGEYPDDVKIRKGVRYSTDEAAFTDGKENVRKADPKGFRIISRRGLRRGKGRRADARSLYGAEIFGRRRRI